ncbi:hypothetical protein Tco_1095678 [Tanacetum coccineum]
MTRIPLRSILGVFQIGIKSQDTVMSDSEDSTAPPSPDYVPDPEYPPLPEFVPEPVYSEFMPPKDDILPAEEQPLPAAVLPTVDSPGYVPKSDPKEDPEEDDDEDPEEDPADYPADRGDDGDDEDESSDDDEDDDVNIEGDEEEEEHPTPADSTIVALPAVDHASSAEETKLFETDESAATPPPHPAYHVTARISIRDETLISLPPREEVERLLAIPTPPSSPLSLCSSPFPHKPSPPLPSILSLLPLSPPLPISSLSLPASPTYPLGYRADMIWLRAEALSTSHLLPLPPPIILSYTTSDAPHLGTPPSGIPPLLPIPAPTSSPSLLLPYTDHGVDKPKVCLPPRKRLCFDFGPRYEVGESSSAAAARPTRGLRADYGFITTLDMEIRRDPGKEVGYGITDTWDDMVEDMQGRPVDTNEIYGRLDDEQTKRRLMAGRLNMLYRDSHAHAHTSDLARAEVMSLRTIVLAQQSKIVELWAADRRRQAVITKMMAADSRRQAQFIEELKLLKRL